MYSATNVKSRFTTHGSNSDHFACVVYDNGWKYSNNTNSGLIDFTPVATDRLIAEVNFSDPETADLIIG
jgi:hypothetical protein